MYIHILRLFSFYLLSFQRAIVSEAKMQVAFEVMNFQATSNADNASYLASLPVSAASSTQVDSFPFNYLKMDDDATLTVMNSWFVSGVPQCVYYSVVLKPCATYALRVLGCALAVWQRQHCWEITAHKRFARLSFSFIDLIVDLLAPMEELLCGT